VPAAGRTIRVAQRPDARAIAGMLARAFDDDPVMMWIFPDERLRMRHLPALFAVLLRRYYLGHQATELVLTGGEVLGCGMWAPPGGWLPRSELGLQRHRAPPPARAALVPGRPRHRSSRARHRRRQPAAAFAPRPVRQHRDAGLP
jgi:hypothetical protein